MVDEFDKFYYPLIVIIWFSTKSSEDNLVMKFNNNLLKFLLQKLNNLLISIFTTYTKRSWSLDIKK